MKTWFRYGTISVVVLTNLATCYLWIWNYFTTQNVYERCVKLGLTSAFVVKGHAYCGVTKYGDSYIGSLSKLEELYAKINK